MKSVLTGEISIVILTLIGQSSIVVLTGEKSIVVLTKKKLKLARLMALLTYKSISSYDDALLWGHHARNH